MPFITCHNKHAINKIKRQVELCKKKIKKRTTISQKESRIYKKLLQFSKNTNNPLQKMRKKILTLQNADM